jgi:hypothetical protein
MRERERLSELRVKESDLIEGEGFETPLFLE